MTWSRLISNPDVKLALRADKGAFSDAGSTPSGDTDVVQEWHDQSTKGNNVTQGTTAKKPLWDVDVFGGNPGIQFDGTDDFLAKASGFLTGAAGAVFSLVQHDAEPTASMAVLASCDEGTNTHNFWCLSRRSDANPYMQITRENADTPDAVQGSTTISQGVNYLYIWSTRGSSYRLEVNNILQTNTAFIGSDSGVWVSDVTLRDHVTIGVVSRNGAEEKFFAGYIGLVVALDGPFPTTKFLDGVSGLMRRYRDGHSI